MPLYHYTSRVAAQSIICSGKLQPGKSGVVYLTPDDYHAGYEAANALSIIGKPIEIRFEIPDHVISQSYLVLPAPRLVAPERDIITGDVIRKGGGREIEVPVVLPIHNPPIQWTALQAP